MSENKYVTMDDKLSKLIEIGAMIIPCGVAMDTVKQYEKLSIREGLTQKPFCTEFWSYWVLINMIEFFDQECREGFLKNITTPMMAFRIYIEQENLSEKDDEILLVKFKDLLPQAEKELKEEVCKRKKR